MGDYADAVTRERDWFLADLSAQGIPPLLDTVGDLSGPFSLVDAYPRMVGRDQNELYLWRAAMTEVRISNARKLVQHHLVATILWWQANDATNADVDQAALDEAIDRVLLRIRDQLGDKTHGGRFMGVGEAEMDGTALTVQYFDLFQAIAAQDAPGAAGTSYRVDIHYTADDEITA